MRDAVDHAECSPSVDDTRPWRWVLHPHRLELHADANRWMARLDPAARELVVSLGSVLLGLQVAAASRGVALQASTLRLPDDDVEPSGGSRPVAVLRPTGGAPEPALGALAPVLTLRRTARGILQADDWPGVLGRAVTDAATGVGVQVHILTPRQASALAGWTAQAAADLPRQDRLRVPADLLARVPLAAVTTARDEAPDWLAAGQTLHRVLLEVTRHGYRGGPSTRLTEHPELRALADRITDPGRHLQALVRIGRGLPVATQSSERPAVG